MFNIQDKTGEERAKDALLALNSHAESSVGGAKANYQVAFNLVWNPIGATPHDVFALAGNEGYKIFQNAMIWIGVIQALDPSWTPPPAPYAFTINPDGTVTLGDLIEVNPE